RKEEQPLVSRHRAAAIKTNLKVFTNGVFRNSVSSPFRCPLLFGITFLIDLTRRIWRDDNPCCTFTMAKLTRNNGIAVRSSTAAKYDAHHNVLSKTYGALADLRRELSDSKSAVAERTELLNTFAHCKDSQRAW